MAQQPGMIYQSTAIYQQPYAGGASLPKQGRKLDPIFDERKAQMLRRLYLGGVHPATVLNFLPMPLMLNSAVDALRNVEVPPCGDDPYTFHTFREPFIDNYQIDNAAKSPHEVLPIELATAFEKEFQTFGGVVIFMGTVDQPGDVDPLERADLKEKIKFAKDRMFAYGHEAVREAEAMWNDPVGSKKLGIVEKHRIFAQMLHNNKRLSKLPAWMTFERTEIDINEPCPNCQTEPKKGAAMCVACNFILNPAKAYELQIIDEFSPALTRLKREQLQELGVSAYVAETTEERKERTAAGLPRPLSVYEQAEAAADAADAENGEEPAAKPKRRYTRSV